MRSHAEDVYKRQAEYNGKKCHAIYNPFRGCFYVDDKYSVIKEKQHKRNEPCR